MSQRKKLSVFQLSAIIFLTVSGGPYGLEPLITNAGGHLALLLLLITPLLWDIPTIFVVLELNSMMPVTGGYYQWVKRAFGLRWAFFEGWWTWLYTFVDLAIYLVLFVEYASFFFPEIQSYKISLCLCIIWSSAYLNIRGVVPVGKASLLLGAAVLIPFIVLFVASLTGTHNVDAESAATHPPSFSTLGMALYTIMWNFIGWDNTTTYAEEVEKPVTTYLSSVTVAFVMILAVYVLAVLVTKESGITSGELSAHGFPAVGTLVAGQWLGGLIAAGGMASALGLYSGVLLSVSRIPQVMAEDKLLPSFLNKLHRTYNTPYLSIITCSVVVSVMVLFTFESLLIIDVTLYGAALFLEYGALIRLRRIAPEEKRPFRVPLNSVGLLLLFLLPLSVFGIAVSATLAGESMRVVLFAIAALLSAEVIWRIMVGCRKVG